MNPLQFLLCLGPNVGRVLVLALAALLSLILLFVFSGPLQILEERLGQLGWTLTADTAPEQRVTIVTIDEKSLAEIGPWPWSREQMATLVTALDDAGVQLQIHDVWYSEPRTGDAELIAALQSARGVVLAQIPDLRSNQAVRVGAMSHPLTGLSCSSAAGLPSTQSYISSHVGFSSFAAGHITPIVASDGAIRQFPAVICVDDVAYPALSISALLQATNSPNWGATLSSNSSWFGPTQELQLDAYPGLSIPLDAAGNLRISYKVSPENYQAVSAADVMSGNIEPGMLENAWVLIGGTALGIGDIVPTPYSGATPGVELQARILGSLLDAQMPYTPKSANWLLALFGIVAAATLLKLAGVSGRVAAYGLPVAGILLPIVSLTLHMQLLNSSEIWLGWIAPAAYSVLAASLLMLLEHHRVRSERSRVYTNLSSYLPSEVAREIAFSLPNSSVSAKRCDVTLLSADLRNFAAFSEAKAPEETAAVLHFFFVRATEIIEQHGGRVHEFKGDGLLAVWDGHDQQVAGQALLAAQDMQLAIDQDILVTQSSTGLEPLALGVGIEQGPVLVGSIGPAHRRSHALLGDTVTIVLRVQEMTAELAQPILVGECAARQLGDQQLESQGSYLLSGLSIPHTLFAPVHVESRRKTERSQPELKVVYSSAN